MGNWLTDAVAKVDSVCTTFYNIDKKHTLNNRRILKECFYSEHPARAGYRAARKKYNETGNVYQAYKAFIQADDSVTQVNRQKLGQFRFPMYEAAKEMGWLGK